MSSATPDQGGESTGGASTPAGWGNDVNNHSNVNSLRTATIARFETVEASLQEIKSLNNQILSKLSALEKNQSARPGKEAEKEQAEEQDETGEKDKDGEKDENGGKTDKDKDKDEGKKENRDSSDHEKDASELKPNGPQRNLDGTLDLFQTTPYEKRHTNNQSERYVLRIWPEVKLPAAVRAAGIRVSEIPLDAYKFRVMLDNSWRLVRASDPTNFLKLRQIQRALYLAAVPYLLWSVRIAPYLEGDFRIVQTYIENNRPVWPQTLEAIFQVMNHHGTLKRPVVIFARLAPYQNENYSNFAWRIRDTFYELTQEARENDVVREILQEHLKNYMPSVWSALQPKLSYLQVAGIIEEATIQAGIVAQIPIENHIYAKPDVNITLQGPTAPYHQLQITGATPSAPGKAEFVQPNAMKTATGLQISDPRSDNQAAYQAEEAEGTELALAIQDMECWKCNKMGHLAKDCKQKQGGGRSGASSGGYKNTLSASKPQQVTLKGTLYQEKGRAFGARAREQFRKLVGAGRGQSNSKPFDKRKKDRAYVAGDQEDDETESLPPSEIWNDYETDRVLSDLLMAMDEDLQAET